MRGDARLALVDGEVDLLREVVRRGSAEVELTTREAALLGYLAARPGEAVSREELQTRVWGYAATSVTRTVDTTVRRLRTKIEPDPARPAHLLTVHGTGYRFVPGIDRPRPTGLVGRDDDLRRLREALATWPVVGVVGGPGVGKSRLVRELADVVHVDVVGDPVASVAAAAGVPLDDGDPLARVAGLLRTRGGTWVLDGVTSAQAAELGRLVAAAGGARVVVVSRERLRVPGAAWVELGPLAPEDAVRLFVARAREADPAFGAPEPVLAAIVERLDGLPLAIQLAAARIHVLGPEELRARLADPMGVLGDGLGRALADAWDDLEPGAREALGACTTFRGSFTLEAAEAVIGVRPALDVLAALRDRSLLHVVRDGGELRFQLLHVVRSFAAARLGDSGAAARHRRWHAAQAQALALLLDGPGAPDALRRLRALRADLEVAADDDPLALDALLEIDGPATERLARLDRAVPDPDGLRRRADALRAAGRVEEARRAALEATSLATEPAVRARARVSLAFVDPEHAAVHAHDALRLVPEGPTAVLAWLAVATAARRRGDRAEAERALRRALERVRADGVVRYEPAVTGNLANLRREAGHPEEAERLYLAAVEACARLGLVRIEAGALHNLGGVLAERGDLDGALAAMHRALERARACGEVGVVAHASHTLGHLLHRAGRLDEAEERYVDAVALLRGLDPALAASALGDLGALQADRGLLDAAERTLDEAAAGLGDDPGARAILEVHRAHLLLARARALGGDEAVAWTERARALVEEACAVDPARCRMAAQLVRMRMEEPHDPPLRREPRIGRRR